ncbi:hypothetical protein LTR08_003305 [Meristemomyces frigidus]|nr:hypothetical protein LTR08_003305 [Meristemomyces frigidus]
MLLPRPPRPSLLHLPAPLRLATHQHRAFSASPPHRLSLVDIAVGGPSALIDTLHTALHIPWYAALPTTAVLVRGVLVYHLSDRPARRAAHIHSSLLPLAFANSLRTVGPLAKTPLGTVFSQLKGMWNATKELHRLGKQFGAPKFHPRVLVNFGVLIAFTEAIRLKCGSGQGLLTIVLSPLQWLARHAFPDQFRAENASAQPAAAAAPSPAVLQQPATAVIPDVLPPATTAAQTSTATLDPATDLAASAYFDPSLQLEGLSWCLDLTAPDPTSILPTILALTLAARIILPQGKKTLPPLNPPPTPPTNKHPLVTALTTLTFLQRLGLGITIAFWFLASNMPAAVLLYLVPSILWGTLQTRWLARRAGARLPTAVRPCKRPLRFRARKQWID